MDMLILCGLKASPVLFEWAVVMSERAMGHSFCILFSRGQYFMEKNQDLPLFIYKCIQEGFQRRQIDLIQAPSFPFRYSEDGQGHFGQYIVIKPNNSSCPVPPLFLRNSSFTVLKPIMYFFVLCTLVQMAETTAIAWRKEH